MSDENIAAELREVKLKLLALEEQSKKGVKKSDLFQGFFMITIVLAIVGAGLILEVDKLASSSPLIYTTYKASDGEDL